jgi:hypothetical protein
MRYPIAAALLFAGLLGQGGACSPAPHRTVAPAGADSAGAHAAAIRFLAAFDSLQWEPFRAALADEVTVFSNSGDRPRRMDGRAAVAANFERFFTEVRAARAQRGQLQGPYLGLGERMLDLRVQWLGEVAVVSFHLAGGTPPSRRTLVFRYQPATGTWQLVHLHASIGPAPTTGS